MGYNIEKYNSKRANIGVTVVPFIYEDNTLKVLLYKRHEDAEEFSGYHALPNAFYDIEKFQTLEDCATYSLAEKTNLHVRFLEQLATFSGSYIDPNRINTVNVSYFSLCRRADLVAVEEHAKFNIEWVDINIALSMELAFNHSEVLNVAYERLKAKASYTPIAAYLLEEEFTILEFKSIIEYFIDEKLDNSRFRDRIQKSDVLIGLDKFKHGNNRPAQLFTLNFSAKDIFYPKSLTKPAEKEKKVK